MDIRPILRLAYDGNYERSIQLLVELIEKQDKRIQELEKIVTNRK